MNPAPEFDVAIVGASVAGCAAAIFFGRAGLRVALIERHPAMDAYKKVCTHFIQPSGVPTLERLGLLPVLLEAGGVLSGMEFWSRWGWVCPPDSGSPAARASCGLNIRRQKLDSILRRTAASTPGVELVLGVAARELLRNEGSTTGLVTAAPDGTAREITARLTVGADGRDSQVARWSGAKASIKRHERFMYYAYYRDIDLGTVRRPRVWVLEPDFAYAFPTDDGLTLLACAPAKRKLAEFKRDIPGSFAALMSGLPQGPKFDESQRVSDFVGIVDFHNVYRSVTGPGTALIGDAALSADFIWGVGCGWALQSAEWLADSTVDALRAGSGLEGALAGYRKRHLAAMRGHFFTICDFARCRRLNPIEMLFLSAGAKDQQSAEHFGHYASRDIGVLQFLSPRAIGRALVASLAR